MLLQVEDLGLPPSEPVGDGHRGPKLVGQAPADRVALLTSDKPRARRGSASFSTNGRRVSFPFLYASRSILLRGSSSRSMAPLAAPGIVPPSWSFLSARRSSAYDVTTSEVIVASRRFEKSASRCFSRVSASRVSRGPRGPSASASQPPCRSCACSRERAGRQSGCT